MDSISMKGNIKREESAMYEMQSLLRTKESVTRPSKRNEQSMDYIKN